MRGHRRRSRCSVVSPSSTVARPRCGSSTPSASSTPRRGAPDRDRRAAHRRRAHARCSSARPTSPTPSGPASARPYLDHAVLERALRRDRRRRRLGRLGLRRRGPGVRRAVRAHRRHLHRPERRGDAPARRQDRLEADRRGGRRAGRAVEPRRGRRPSTTRCAAADEIGYPLMLKATAGGGGRGIRDGHLATRTWPTPTSAPATRRARAFGSGVVFLERLVTGARHVEVQVIADGQGTAWALGRARLLGAAAQPEGHRGVRLAGARPPSRPPSSRRRPSGWPLAVGYRGAGTVEFLYHPGEKLFAFLEVNTRLQVEHPITEVTTDIDLVKAQIHVAAGGRLEGEPPAELGHAVEARLNAEDPDRDFAPVPGPDRAAASCPPGPGIRVDTGVSEGDTIPRRLRLDDRQDHRLRPRPATRRWPGCAARCAETTVVIEGGATNKSFLLDLLDQPEVIDGERRHRLDRPGPRRGPPGRAPALRRRAGRRRDRGVRGRGAGRAAAAARDRARRPPAGAARGRPRRSTSSCAASAYRVTRRPDRAAPLPGRRRRRRRRRRPSTPSSSGSTSTPAGSSSTAAATGWSPRPTGRSTWSRSTASRTGSAATRAACCARRPRRWSSRPRWRSATRSRPARRCSCWRA